MTWTEKKKKKNEGTISSDSVVLLDCELSVCWKGSHEGKRIVIQRSGVETRFSVALEVHWGGTRL